MDTDIVGLNELIYMTKAYVKEPTKGLPEELFLFVSGLTPMVNVDLLIRDRDRRVLLAWRNDLYHGNGWHVPGGIIRLKESFEDRIQKTAEREIGSHVISAKHPTEIVPIITEGIDVRCHFITFVYECSVPDEYQIDNRGRREKDTGYLGWHSTFPKDMLECHGFYRKYFR